jgi:hypothetical protein
MSGRKRLCLGRSELQPPAAHLARRDGQHRLIFPQPLRPRRFLGLQRPLIAHETQIRRGKDRPDPTRHCEERKRRSNPGFCTGLDCFAAPVIGPATSGRTRWLAMTASS